MVYFPEPVFKLVCSFLGHTISDLAKKYPSQLFVSGCHPNSYVTNLGIFAAGSYPTRYAWRHIGTTPLVLGNPYGACTLHIGNGFGGRCVQADAVKEATLNTIASNFFMLRSRFL